MTTMSMATRWHVPWWRHQMETFSALLVRCAGNSPVTGEFPSQRPVTWSFDVFFDLHPNKRLNKPSRRLWFEMPSHSLWRHCNDRSGTGNFDTSSIGTFIFKWLVMRWRGYGQNVNGDQVTCPIEMQNYQCVYIFQICVWISNSVNKHSLLILTVQDYPKKYCGAN